MTEWAISYVNQHEASLSRNYYSISNSRIISSILADIHGSEQSDTSIEFLDSSTCIIHSQGKSFHFKLFNVPTIDVCSAGGNRSFDCTGSVISKLIADVKSDPNRISSKSKDENVPTSSNLHDNLPNGITILSIDSLPKAIDPVRTIEKRQTSQPIASTDKHQAKRKAATPVVSKKPKISKDIPSWVSIANISTNFKYEHIHRHLSGITIKSIYGVEGTSPYKQDSHDTSTCSYYIEFQNGVGTELALLRNGEVISVKVGGAMVDMAITINAVHSTLETFWAKAIGYHITDDYSSMNEAFVVVKDFLPVELMSCDIMKLIGDTEKLVPESNLSPFMIHSSSDRPEDVSKVLASSTRTKSKSTMHYRDVIGQNTVYELELKMLTTIASSNSKHGYFHGLLSRDNDSTMCLLDNPLVTLLKAQSCLVDLRLSPLVSGLTSERKKYADEKLRRMVDGFKMIAHETKS